MGKRINLYSADNTERTNEDASIATAKFMHSATEITMEGWREKRKAFIVGKRYYLIEENFPKWKVSDVMHTLKNAGIQVVDIEVHVTPAAVAGIEVPE